MYLQWFLMQSETRVMSRLWWSYTIPLNVVPSTRSPSPCHAPSHTHSVKTHSNRTPRSLSDPSLRSSVKKERLLFLLLPGIITGTKRPQKSEEEGDLSVGGPSHWSCRGHAGRRGRQSRGAQHRRDAGPNAQQLLLLALVKAPGLETAKYPRVRGKPRGFSGRSCYTICTVEKRLSR